MVRNESWDFQQAILMPFSDFTIWFSKLSTLHLHFAQMRFGKLSSLSNVASLSWLAFLPNNATLWWL